MPQTPSLNVRPTFNRAVTDESIIPMAHLDRMPSGHSVRSHTSDQTSPDALSQADSRTFSFIQPLVRTQSQYGEQPPVMAPPLESPVHTGPESRARKLTRAVAQPFQPRGVVFERAAQVMPYWREGLFVATTIGMATWLGVISGRMRQLEDIPYCVVPSQP